ncbi:EGF-like domain-containing protein [Oopsacas minuta]|uniref:EGF-like domain-containing protein n=1 Tax=Oopsacas minuta TaxID=111878 RepID=A0AAV7JXP5_9METZ|nr:EGF-like domain-containing protein [Oopsacas minuta]
MLFVDVNECADSNGGCQQKCVNTGGSYYCECGAGYNLAVDERSCYSTTEDPCLLNNGGCEHICITSGNNYYCSCYVGYDLYTDNKRCFDADECLRDLCPGDLSCTNTPGSYTCSCSAGYDQEGDSCIDVNECLLNVCDHICTNKQGSYQCSCRAGYNLYQARSCYKYNCEPGGDGCRCIPTVGDCLCIEGYEIGAGGVFCQDVDECSVNEGDCIYGCENTIGSYVCSCPVGTVLSSDNICIDEDECSTGNNNNCQQVCVNTDGGYQCACLDGYQLDGEYTCTDVDECALRTYECDSDQSCVNYFGSYSCECSPGYFKNTQTSQCEDINECSDTNTCEQNCINLSGTYECECNAGYELYNFYQCRDINECLAIECTQNNQYCRNTEGSYVCDCEPEYRKNVQTDICEDIDECIKGSHSCEQICVNSDGSYTCDCSGGYYSSSFYGCTDIDECASPNSNTCNDKQICLNIQGSHLCYCRSGFTTLPDGSCLDVDECEYNLCDHTCHNTEGSYQCTCDEGFLLYRNYRSCSKSDCSLGDAGCGCVVSGSDCICNEGYEIGNANIFCQDIDECSQNNGGCSHSCVNTPGSHECGCPEGLEISWNGQTCIEIVSCTELNGGCEQSCEETNPGVECSCWDGYYLDTDAKSCIVHPPCYLNGGCQDFCNEIEGRGECSCRTGYRLGYDRTSCYASFCYYAYDYCDHYCDNSRRTCGCKEGFAPRTSGYNCADIDECAYPHLSGCSHTCENTEGSYICTCPEGLWVDTDGKTCRENPPGCGGSLFTSTTGSTLPIITGPFPLQCEWKITAPQGQLALFRIYYLSLGLPFNCDDWGIEVWDPRAPSYSLLRDQCYGAYEEYTASAGNELLIKIHAERDFKFYYQFFYYAIEDNVFGSSECQQTISLGSNFSSPNFPQPYSPDSQCSILITGLRDRRMGLRFYYFNVESSPDCERDYVILRDTTYNSNTYNQPLARWCGNEVPDPVYSVTGVISLVFYSDSSVQTGGFYGTTF